jgi:hydrogenase/urease accessory protein HupE
MRADRRLLSFLLALVCAMPVASWAHDVRPGYLRVVEAAPQRFDVIWKQPIGGSVAKLMPRLSSGAFPVDATELRTRSFQVHTWHDIPALDGQTLIIEGLERTITDVLVDIRLLDGRRIEEILTPRRASMVLRLSEAGGTKAGAYLGLGVRHILEGFDHLLFVLGLVLLSRGFWDVLRTVTAFTIAHSITLAATALGFVTVRSALIESLVAASIVFLAVELIRSYRGRFGLTHRHPWLIAFVFGLLHGCAFAGALAEIGLPQGDLVSSLLLFNLGVEAGQLMFVAVALPLTWAARRLPPHAGWLRWVPPYATGAIATFWFVERYFEI